jgi:hypothetical protein
LLKGAAPRLVPPSLNVTLPVALAGVTVAVRLTVWPTAAGFGEEVRTVVVPADDVITSVTATDVLAPFVESPPYTAVSEWLPAVRLEVVYVAVPPAIFAVPSTALPSLKVTVPVAVDGVTLAVNVTDCPLPAVLGDALRVVAVCAVAGLITSMTAFDVLTLLLVSPL